MPFARSFVLGLALCLPLIAGALASASPVSPQDCSALLMEQVDSPQTLTPWNKLSKTLGGRLSATLLVRLALPDAGLSIAQLASAEWAADLGVRELREFATLTRDAWYMVIDGDQRSLLRAQAALAERYGSKNLSFDILGDPTAKRQFRMSAPAHYLEVTDADIEARDTDQNLRGHADVAAVVYEQSSGAVYFALPEAQMTALHEDLLAGLDIEFIEDESRLSLAGRLRHYGAKPSSKMAFRHGRHWIVSQRAFHSLRSLEGTELETPVAAETEALAAFLRARRQEPACTETVCVTPIPQDLIAPLLPTPIAVSSLPEAELTDAEFALLADLDSGLLREMTNFLRGEAGLTWKTSGSLAAAFNQWAEKRLPGPDRARAKARLGLVSPGNWDAEVLYKYLSGTKSAAHKAIVRFGQLWKIMARELDPHFAKQPQLTAEAIRQLIADLNATSAPEFDGANSFEPEVLFGNSPVPTLDAQTPATAPGLPTVSEAEVALLTQVDNGLLADMMAALKELNKVSWTNRGSVRASFESAAAILLAPEDREDLLALIPLQKDVASDGVSLHNMLRGKTSAVRGATSRFASLWKALIGRLAPEIHAPLSEESIRAAIAALKPGAPKSPQRAAVPKTVPATAIPVSSVTEAELLADSSNGLLREMLLALNKNSGVYWTHKNSMHAHYKSAARRLLSAREREEVLAVVAQQKDVGSDGLFLNNLSKGKASSLAPVVRFITLWKALAARLAPAAAEGDDRLTPETLRHMISILAKANEKAAAKVKKEATPKLEKAPGKSRAKLDPETAKRAEEMAEVVRKFIQEHSKIGWWKPGQIEIAFGQVFAKVVSNYELKVVQGELAGLGFGAQDATKQKEGGIAFQRMMMAMKMLAVMLDPELSEQEQNADWIRNVIAAYETRLAKLEERARAEKNKPELIRGDQVDRASLRGGVDHAFRGPIEIESSLPRNTEISFAPELAVMPHLKSSLDFKDFLRAYAYLAADANVKTGRKDILYYLPGQDALTVSFIPEPIPGSKLLRLKVTEVKKAGPDHDAQLYSRIARQHGIEEFTYEFKNGRSLKIDDVLTNSLYISARVHTKIQIKHRISKQRIDHVLAALRTVSSFDRDSSMGEVSLEGTVYRVFLTVAEDQTVHVRTLFEKESSFEKSKRK